MNLKYMKVSLFEITYKKDFLLFHNILIYWDAPVNLMTLLTPVTLLSYYI